jgi:hypothetical protein
MEWYHVSLQFLPTCSILDYFLASNFRVQPFSPTYFSCGVSWHWYEHFWFQRCPHWAQMSNQNFSQSFAILWQPNFEYLVFLDKKPWFPWLQLLWFYLALSMLFKYFSNFVFSMILDQVSTALETCSSWKHSHSHHWLKPMQLTSSSPSPVTSAPSSLSSVVNQYLALLTHIFFLSFSL